MSNYYLAIDIGASSGRHILGTIKDGKIETEEIYRFENKLINKNEQLCWDIKNLESEIINGIKKCKEINKIPKSLAIDTWGVDFVLLDSDNNILGDTVSYRDKRTELVDLEVYKLIDKDSLYRSTGIQKMIFNSIYQLYSLKLKKPEILEKAKTFLMIPDYFNFVLTGKKVNEYTNATTTQLINAKTKTWDEDIIKTLGFDRNIFNEIKMPKEVISNLSEDISSIVGFDCSVVLAPSHDTASAVVSVPDSSDDKIFLSSGTWSLMGIEREEADCSILSKAYNFTNEGGYDYRFRYLKNIMGLWIIQSIKKELSKEFTFPVMSKLAKESKDFSSRIDVNDKSFLAPKSMIEAINEYCMTTNQIVPSGIPELLSCVYNSLAESYADTINEIETITDKKYSKLYIVGGGCQDNYLNALTAEKTHKTVFAGPIEATAIGNILTQMISFKEFASLEEGKKYIGGVIKI